MKKLTLYLLAAMMIFAAGCRKFDDSAIWDKLNAHESRLNALEQLCSQMNTNISSLQLVVEALQNKDYVTNIAPITEDGKIIGYTITFSKSGSVTIYHGKDGKDGINGVDGTTPVIGVKKHNGVYYWTLDGEWLLDSDGKKIKAEGRDGHNGDDGTNGKNGITPKLKIENEYWYVSYDNGSTWTNLGKATSDSSNSGSSNEIITDVDYDEGCVYITLADGTELIISRCQISEIFYTATAKVQLPVNAYWGYDTYVLSNKWDSTTGEGVITLNGELLSINSFENCETLTGITIPDGVMGIGSGAFFGCSNLKSITIPESVEDIGSSAFSGCESLESIVIPDGVEYIDSYAFYGCTSLKTVSGPDWVGYLGENAFENCTSLENITFGDVDTILPSTFQGCTSLKNVSIQNVTSIAMYAFKNCTSLETISSLDGVEHISYNAFENCTSLTSISFGDSLTAIQSYAFAGCTSLESFTITENVDGIDEGAFSGCTSLAAVYCKPTTPPSLGGSVFKDTASDLKIYVPAGSLQDYKYDWYSYASIIEETTNP